jgi:hypothetical protein
VTLGHGMDLLENKVQRISIAETLL